MLFRTRCLALGAFLVIGLAVRASRGDGDLNFGEGNRWSQQDGRLSAYAFKNSNDPMDDRFFIKDNVESTGVSLFAVFDGHGGQKVAEYAYVKLIESLRTKIVSMRTGAANALAGQDVSKSNPDIAKYISLKEGVVTKNYSQLLTDEIAAVDEMINKELGIEAKRSGSTVLIGILEDKQLTIANLGDSVAVYMSKEGATCPLTAVHTPGVEDERLRLEQLECEIKRDDNFSYSVHANGYSITLSRSLGDFNFKENPVIVLNVPFVVTRTVDELSFVFLGSSSVWDVLKTDEVMEIIKEGINTEFSGLKNVMEKAAEKQQEEGIITGVLIKF